MKTDTEKSLLVPSLNVPSCLKIENSWVMEHRST